MSGLPESRSGFGLRRLWALLLTELVALAKWGLPGRLQWGIRESGKGVRSQIGGVRKRCQEPNWWTSKVSLVDLSVEALTPVPVSSLRREPSSHFRTGNLV